MANAKKDVANDALETERLFAHPGFLLRRAQQIAVSSFVEHYGQFGVTSTQSAILKIVHRWPGIDQVGVGRMLGLDRTTAATSVSRLAAEKMLERRDDPADRRRRTLFISAKGEKLLLKIGDMSASAKAMLAVFSGDDAQTFMRLLDHFVQSSNDTIRIPMETVAPPQTGRAKKKRSAT